MPKKVDKPTTSMIWSNVVDSKKEKLNEHSSETLTGHDLGAGLDELAQQIEELKAHVSKLQKLAKDLLLKK